MKFSFLTAKCRSFNDKILVLIHEGLSFAFLFLGTIVLFFELKWGNYRPKTVWRSTPEAKRKTQKKYLTPDTFQTPFDT